LNLTINKQFLFYCDIRSSENEKAIAKQATESELESRTYYGTIVLVKVLWTEKQMT